MVTATWQNKAMAASGRIFFCEVQEPPGAAQGFLEAASINARMVTHALNTSPKRPCPWSARHWRGQRRSHRHASVAGVEQFPLS